MDYIHCKNTLKDRISIYSNMPSKGKAEYNKEYYANNAEDICYRKKVQWKEAKTIRCRCSEFARYKDTTSSRNAHFKTATHRIWEKKQKIYDLMTKNGNSQAKAEQYVLERLERKRARTSQDVINLLNKITNQIIDEIDRLNDDDNVIRAEPEPETENVVLEEHNPDVPHIPPSAAFDPMSLALPSK